MIVRTMVFRKGSRCGLALLTEPAEFLYIRYRMAMIGVYLSRTKPLRELGRQHP